MAGLVRIGISYDRVRLGARRMNSRRLMEAVDNIVSNQGEIDLFITPPYPLTGPVVGYYTEEKAKTYVKSHAERLSNTGGGQGQTFVLLSRIADSHDIHVISGPIIERAGPKLYITSFHVAPGSRLVGRYRKLGVTKEEAGLNVNPGKEAAVFEARGVRVGVFVDEDLALPCLFRYLQLRRVNLIVGFMFPHPSPTFPWVVDEETKLRTIDTGLVSSALGYVSRLVGVPIILVGGVVEGSNGSHDVAYSPLIAADPESGVHVARTYSDVGRPVRIEIDPSSSVAKPCDLGCHQALNFISKVMRKSGGKKG